MASPRQLKNAPVKEALIDIQFESSIELTQIDTIADRINESFSKRTDIWQTVLGFGHSETGEQQPANNTLLGRRLESKDGRFVLLIRRNGLAVSRLAPYVDWDELRNVAKACWSDLLEVTGLPSVSRVAVRYINEIKIPLPIGDFDEFLTCPPTVPTALPQAISEFLTRVVIPDPDRQTVSIVTQALQVEPSFLDGKTIVPIILDIDVFRVGGVSAAGDEIWGILDILREQKNKLFFEHLTEKAVELFQ